MFDHLKEKIKSHSSLKKLIHHLLIHPVRTRPRLWLRWCRFLYIQRGKGAVIYHSARMDVAPFNTISIGKYTVIESFATINNLVGDVLIGNHTRIGLHNTIIGPVYIGNDVNIAQNVTISGLNHNYTNPDLTISSQGISTASIHIDNDVWIGANAVLLAGITIGSHSVIAAGSVVTHDVPSYSVAAGNPAHIIKHYDSELKQWIKTKSPFPPITT